MKELPVLRFSYFCTLLALCLTGLLDRVTCNGVFEESLKLKSLPSGHIYSHLEFTIREKSLSNDTKIFPRVLGEMLEAHQIQELHFSLTQGYWRLGSWGEPVIAAPTGAQVVAWFNSEDSQHADKNWNGFTSRLSGLTCASLNFLDVKTSIVPKFAYRPRGVIHASENKTAFVRVGNLPKENVCTENLTPWSKLLPCGLSRGLASLLRSKQVFNTHYHSAGIHVTQSRNEIILKLTLSLVFDPPTKLKVTDSIARRVLGSLAIFPCHPASKTTVQIWDGIKEWKTFTGDINLLRIEDLPKTDESAKNLVFKPVKYMGGYGQEYGSMIIEMTNYLTDRHLPVLYVEVLPWYIRPYLHTMKVDVKPEGKKLQREPGKIFDYTPGQDRKSLHKLEMDILIPPSSTVTLSFTVEKGHLKWNEYPPDANHGFYLEAAHFEVNSTDSTANQESTYYYSRILLVNLSTPDFSMPYNVICLTCTVVALAFGPIHNITTKQLKLSVLATKSEKMKQLKEKMKQKLKYFGFFSKTSKKQADQAEDEGQKENTIAEEIIESNSSSNNEPPDISGEEEEEEETYSKKKNKKRN